MSLLGTCRESGGVAIVDFGGNITLGEGSSTLRQMIGDLVAQGHRKILLNLADVDYSDSAGSGELVTANTIVRNVQGEIKLRPPTNRIHPILQITRLFTVFAIQIRRGHCSLQLSLGTYGPGFRPDFF